MERLDKILANTGRWSRKEARELVRAGRVAVDGVTAQAADGKYDPAARFEVDGETVSGERLVYLMLHKLSGAGVRDGGPRQPTVLELAAPASAPGRALPGGTAGQGHRGPAPAHQ
ncbi:MAG: S4 domain-containing protein [Flavonifractor plautii]